MSVSIGVVDQPTLSRPGRKPRLSRENLSDLANGIKAGHWVSDQVATPKKSTAYQRACAAKRGLAEQFNLTNVQVHTELEDKNDPEGKWIWSLGPLDS